MIIEDLVHMNCDICFKPMENKVILQCNHILCLRCVIFIMKATKRYFSCPTCRKKYYNIYIDDCVVNIENILTANMPI
jgi:hypothetical protein